MKDQSKKVANLKHKEQVEKNKNAQLMEEARKREDNINESSQQVKVKRAPGIYLCDSLENSILYIERRSNPKALECL